MKEMDTFGKLFLRDFASGTHTAIFVCPLVVKLIEGLKASNAQ